MEARFELSNQQILEYLGVIDEHLHMPCKLFDIAPFAGRKIDDIAAAMMRHVGLGDYEPVIEYDRLENNTGGYIELNNNPDRKVYITLSDDLSISKESKYATLAHEICHKLLYVHGCYFQNLGDYNEMLTDLATIYAGFGKLTLNGCLEVSRSKQNVFNIGTGRTDVQTTTTTRYTGYLDIVQYAVAYRFVCYVNRISDKEAESGLDSEALPVIRANQRVAAVNGRLTDIPEALRQYRLRTYKEDAAMMQEVVLMEAALGQIKKDITLHQQEQIKELGVVDAKNGEITQPYRVLWKTLFPEITPYQSENEPGPLSHRLMSLLGDSRIQDTTLHIACPVCGYAKENALKEHKKSLIRCPKCSHVFYWDSSMHKPSKLKLRLAAFFMNIACRILR